MINNDVTETCVERQANTILTDPQETISINGINDNGFNYYQFNQDGIAYRDLPPREQYRLCVERLVNKDVDAADMPLSHLVLAESSRKPWLGNTDGVAGQSINQWDIDKEQWAEDSKGRLKTDKFIPDLYGAIAKVAESKDGGITWLPNQPKWGWKKLNIEGYHLLFFEVDDRSIDDQWKLISWLVANGIIPTVVFSAGGSLHVYIVLDKPGNDWQRWEWLSKKTIDIFGGDPNIVGQIRRFMRFPGFPRREKGRYQTLEMLAPDDAKYSLDFIESVFKLWFEENNKEWEDYAVFQESERVKSEKIKNREPIDLSQFDGSDVERLLIEIDQQIPVYVKHGGTYQKRFNCAIAVKTLLGCSEKAKALMPNLFSVSSIGWNSLETISNPLGCLINNVRPLVNNPQWKPMKWWRDLYQNVSNFTKGIKAAIASAIERKIYRLIDEGEQFFGDGQEYLKRIHDLILMGNVVLDRRGTGYGKTHDVTHNARLIFPNGKIFIICPSPRKFPIKDADKLYVRVLGRNDKLWTQVGTELIPHDIGDAPDDAIKKFHCPLTPKFKAIAAKGYQESIYSGDTSICKTCPFKKQCTTQKGWFKKDWRDAVSNESNLIIHPDGVPRDICLDNEKISAAIDEVETTLNPFDELSDTKDGLRFAIEYYADILGDDNVSNARKIIRALNPAFDSKERYGLDHSKVMALAKDCNLDGIEELIQDIPKHYPDFEGIFKNDSFDGFTETPNEVQQKPEQTKNTTPIKSIPKKRKATKIPKKSKSFLAEIEADLTDIALQKLPSNTLLYVLLGLMGDKSVNLSICNGKITATVHNPKKYQFLNRFSGLLLMSATANVEDLSRELCLDKPIKAIWMGQDKPLSNLTINAYRMTGIKSNQLTHQGIKDRLTMIKNHFDGMPCICPKRWRRNVAKPSQHSFIDADGHWMADSRGSNAFEGIPELLVMSLPKPNIGAVKARYLTANGSLDGWEDYYQRLQSIEAIQLIGRPRCQRYPDRNFVINWIIDDTSDLNYLAHFGATITPAPIASIIPEAGSRWEIAQQSILDVILKLKYDGVEVSQNKIAKHLGRDQGSLSKLLKRNNVNLSELIDTVEQGMSSVIKDSNNKRHNPESQTTQEFWELWHWQLQASPGDTLEDLAYVVESQGWEQYWKQLKLFPIECQAKTMAVIQGQLDLESSAIPA